MGSIFKAYDIRGIYGADLTDEIAYKIGRAFVTLVGCRNVAIGRDIRPHSEPLFEAFARGCTDQGTSVIDLGHVSTPMSYFANGRLQTDASVMITASHNPAQWNGFKLCRANTVPISGATGIQDIERIVQEESFNSKASLAGHISRYDIAPEYAEHIRQFARLSRPLKIAVDFANGMGIWEAKSLEGILSWDGLYDKPDGHFPNHEANPLRTETLHDLQEQVRNGQYDFGVAFDGDADRVGFVDETGEIISMDLMTALIAQDILSRQKGTIFYDLRSSRVVKEVIESAGGKAMMSRVGHAFIKQQMRDNDALFAGELSGHYYFKDNFTTESAALAVLSVANLVSASGQKLSELVQPLRKYFASGEINTRVNGDTKPILNKLKAKYITAHEFELDGVSIEFPDWWFNVRCSNTEPLIRLNLEADTQEKMEQKRDEVLDIIRGN
ncbi:MAG: phosphomannomutase/phosphoglucomutase [Kiritimatiellae bacterium]|nr:phosphomannomutase/phosphoglucomutase [Kiritimatiellia bacterium]